MKHIQKVIELAVEGGYSKPPFYGEHYIQRLSKRSMLLDPLFWQALGKARGWVDPHISPPWRFKEYYNLPDWLYQWHNFIDHLATGKDPDSFFAELLS